MRLTVITEGAGNRVTWPTILTSSVIDRVMALSAPGIRELLSRLLQAWVTQGEGGSEEGRVDVVHLPVPSGKGAQGRWQGGQDGQGRGLQGGAVDDAMVAGAYTRPLFGST